MKKHWKKIVVSVLGLGLLGSATLVGIAYLDYKSVQDSPTSTVYDKGFYNMTVNGEKLSYVEFEDRFNSVESFWGQLGFNLNAQNMLEVKESFQSELIENMVLEEAIRQELKENGLKVTNEDIQKFKESLDLSNSQISNRQLERYVEKVQNRKLLLKDMISKIEVSDSEIEEYYNQNKEELENYKQLHLKQILVDTEEKALEVQNLLNKGSNFEDLVSKYVEDESIKEREGYIGKYARGSLPLSLEEVAFSLSIGETSETVKTDFGYHILKLEDIEKIEKLEDIKLELKEYLVTKKKEEVILSFTEEVMKGINVKQ